MPKTSVRPAIVQMVDVYRHGQNRLSEPAFRITLEQASWWFTIGAATLGEPAGTIDRKRKGGKLYRCLVLSKPTSDRLQLRSSTGVGLTWACLWASLAGRTPQDDESLALAQSFAPAHMQVTVLPGWTTPDVVFNG